MPQGSISKPAGTCVCGNQLVAIYWTDGFGLDPELMEVHCKRCGFTKNSEGVITNPGRNIEGQNPSPSTGRPNGERR